MLHKVEQGLDTYRLRLQGSALIMALGGMGITDDLEMRFQRPGV